MSYEGYDIGLCCRGHRSVKDAYDSWPENDNGDEKCGSEACPHPLVWVQSVDVTNGEDESNPWTYPRELEVHGHDDIPRVDHYGNKYFEKDIRFKIPPGGAGEGHHVFVNCKICKG